MSYFEKLNKKLDEGWKLTDMNCPICKSVVVGKLDTKEYFCIECALPVKIQQDTNELDDMINDLVNNDNAHKVKKTENGEKQMPSKNSTDDLSKKLGEKLLSGWTMLEEICEGCMVPLMRKGTEYVCVGCGPKKKNQPELPKVEEKKAKESKAENLPIRIEDSPAIKKKKQGQAALVNTNIQLQGDVMLDFRDSLALYSKMNHLLQKYIERNEEKLIQIESLEKFNQIIKIQHDIDTAKNNILNIFKDK